MFYINKIVGWLSSPFGVLFLGLAVSWLLARCGWKKTARGICATVLALFWLLGCELTVKMIGLPLERMNGTGCVLDMEKIPSGDAIVLLGGGMGAHVECGASEMYAAADRTWMAAKLYKAGKAPLITLTGGGADVSTIPLLRDFGVPESACLYFREARNTEEESKRLRDALGGKRKILLVTSAFHTPRAKRMFERRGFETVPCPTDFELTGIAENPLQIRMFFPTADMMARNSCAVKEWVALLGYSILRR